MTIYLQDGFSRTGDLSDSAPDVVSEAGQTWFGSPTLSCSAGAVVSSSASASGCNITPVSVSGALEFELSFSLTMGAVLPAVGTFADVAYFQLIVGGRVYQVRLHTESSASVFKLQLNSLVTGTVFTVALSAGATYAGVLRVAPGAQRLDFMGVSVVRSESYADAFEPVNLEIATASGAAIGPIVLRTPEPPLARIAAPGPLGSPALLAATLLGAHAAAAGPLGSPALLAAGFTPAPGSLSAYAAAPSPLAALAGLALHDFTGLLGDARIVYVMDLVTPGGAVRVPVSSWQATLQTGGSNYVQCVVPACAPWAPAINEATEFVIYRTAVLPGAPAYDYEMARAPLEQVSFDRGPERYTCTISGYSAGFAEDMDPPAAYDRALVGVRSVSNGTGGTRVRCAVDWLLRPGHRAFAGEQALVVGYINYYAPTGFDSYMDVGSRP